MCSIVWVHRAGRLCLLHQRDEDPQRAEIPPDAVCPWPRDSRAGGAWVGINRQGLLLAVTNRSEPGPRSGPAPRSRGSLVHDLLLTAADLDTALARLTAAAVAGCAPGRLLLIQAGRYAVAQWQDGVVRVDAQGALPATGLLTAHGLGDGWATAWRRQRFAELTPALRGLPWDPATRLLETYLDLRHPRRPSLGLRMARVGAVSVSRTAISVAAGRATIAWRRLVDPARTVRTQVTLDSGWQR